MQSNHSHFINIGPHGRFKKTGEFGSSPAQIDEFFREMDEKGKAHFIIYFHGGLVSEASGRETAERLTEPFSQIGAQPIFFIWETGLREILRDNLPRILDTPIVKQILLIVLKQVTKRWGIDLSGKGAVELNDEQLNAELEKERPFEKWDVPEESGDQVESRGSSTPLDEASLEKQTSVIEAEIDETINEEKYEIQKNLIASKDEELIDAELREAIIIPGAKAFEPIIIAGTIKVITKTVFAVLRRRVRGEDHGLYPTVIEELLRAVGLAGVGRPVWEFMKVKAEDMWQPDLDQTIARDIEGAHVGSYFLQKLAEYFKKKPDTIVDLVGHSAGSIAICNMLSAVVKRHPAIRISRIVLLAPAATMKLFHAEMVTHPERYEDFRMYTMKDEWEIKDAIGGRFYPYSLLYFVSGVLEENSSTPLCGLARCFSGSAPYQTQDLSAVHYFLNNEKPGRIVLSQENSNQSGLNSMAIHHGDFDNDDATITSIQAFLKR